VNLDPHVGCHVGICSPKRRTALSFPVCLIR
jgi:hypothetical protein